VPRNHKPRGKPQGRKPIPDQPIGRGVQLAVHLDGIDMRRAIQFAAQALAEQRQANRSPIPITPKNARLRVKEVVEQLSAPLTGREHTLVQAYLPEALPGAEAAAQAVRQSPNPRQTLRDLQMLAVARSLLAGLPRLRVAVAVDPSLLGQLFAVARNIADEFVAKAIVTIPFDLAGNYKLPDDADNW
jgi:hypothetical protein